MANDHARVMACQVVTGVVEEGETPSDHYPVLAVYEIGGEGARL